MGPRRSGTGIGVMITVTLTVRLPWWTPLYIGLLRAMSDAGVLIVDADVAADFISRNARIEVM